MVITDSGKIPMSFRFSGDNSRAKGAVNDLQIVAQDCPFGFSQDLSISSWAATKRKDKKNSKVKRDLRGTRQKLSIMLAEVS